MWTKKKIFKTINSPRFKLLATAVIWSQILSNNAQSLEDDEINAIFHDPISNLLTQALVKCNDLKFLLLDGVDKYPKKHLDFTCDNLDKFNSSLMVQKNDYFNFGSMLTQCVKFLCPLDLDLFSKFPATYENTKLRDCINQFCGNITGDNSFAGLDTAGNDSFIELVGRIEF